MGKLRLTIFGAGLIGGSIAWSAQKQGLASRITAIDISSPPTDLGPFDEWVSASDESAVDGSLAESDLVVLCVPVSLIIQLLPKVLAKTEGVVTDCGSTKAAILSSIAGADTAARFVPGHPMAGHPEGGLKNAQADLFEGRKWILCSEGASPHAKDLVSEFVRKLGARPLQLSAEEHDRSVAVTSHVPQVVASALSVFAEEEAAKQAAGPGFDSATRVAGGAEAMWRDIFETNAQAVGRALSEVGQQLQNLGAQLQDNDPKGALDVLEKARSLRGSKEP